MATFGAIYTAYNTEVASWTGYHENKAIADESYSPSSTADKAFFLQCPGSELADEGGMSGNTEMRYLDFLLTILYRYPGAEHSTNEAATLDLIDAAIKSLYGLSVSGVDIIVIGRWELKPLEKTAFKVFTLPFMAKIQWATA